MTRPTDVAPPAVTPHPLEPDAPIADWLYRPVVALERLPAAAYVWDDSDDAVVWDDPDPDRYVWDAPFIGGGFTDAVCDFMAIDIDPGEPDELYLFPPTVCTITLDNRDGAYTPWTADGRLVYWAPGRQVAVWTIDQRDGSPWWLFSGRVASWNANAVDRTVTVVAYDGLAQLAQQLGGDWTPGAAGQTVAQRFAAVAASAGYTGRLDVEPGDVTLATVTGTDAPLEHLQRVALSDGGLVYGDVDGSIDYRNRLWRAGRTDAPAWVVGTNVCDAPVIVWNPEASADDDRLATDVRLVNTTGLIATAAATDPLWAGTARYRLAHPDPDFWTTQAQGNALATYLIAQQSTPGMALQSLELYVLDRRQSPDVADLAARLRRGDRVEVLHEFVDDAGNPAQLDVFAVCLGVAHAITPDEWVATAQLSKTVDFRQVELWDVTRFEWDGTDPNNVWRY